MVRKGTTLTFVVTGDVRSVFPYSAQDLRSDSAAVLTEYFSGVSVVINESGNALLSAFDWSYRATARITTRMDYNKVDDVQSVVRHAFWESSGNPPNVALVTSSDRNIATEPPPQSSTDDGNKDGEVPWTNALVFLSVAIGLVAIFGLKKL